MLLRNTRKGTSYSEATIANTHIKRFFSCRLQKKEVEFIGTFFVSNHFVIFLLVLQAALSQHSICFI